MRVMMLSTLFIVPFVAILSGGCAIRSNPPRRARRARLFRRSHRIPARIHKTMTGLAVHH